MPSTSFNMKYCSKLLLKIMPSRKQNCNRLGLVQMSLLLVIVIQLGCGFGTLKYGLEYRARLRESQVATGEMYPIHLTVPGKSQLSYIEGNARDGNWFPVEGVQAERDWASIIPPGGGHVWFGPETHKRRFGVGLFHQLHCLNALRKAVIAADTGPHSRHCLNYIRQAVLCHADPTMELSLDPGIGTNITHVCRDWNSLYDEASQNYYEHEEWKKNRGIHNSGHEY